MSLTFVNGFSLAAAGNFAKAFKIDKMLSYQPNLQADSTEAYAVIAGLFLAVVLIAFAIVMVVYISVLLVMRIVYLWILIILSPLAFLLRAVPAGAAGGYYKEWWGMFIKYNVTGPVLAFFLWLSLLVVANDGVTKDIPSAGTVDTPAVTIPTNIFQPEHLQGFIVSICLLYAGTVVAGKLGSPSMGQVAGKAKGVASSAIGGIRKTARGVSGAAGWVGDKTPLGRASTGAKMGAYKALSVVPGMRDTGLKGLSQLRAQEAARGAESAKWLANLTPEERARRAKSILPTSLMSAEQRGVRKQVLAQRLDDITSGRGVKRLEGEDDASYRSRVNKEFQSSRREYENIGKDTYDRGVTEKLSKITAKRPDLIVDDAETDPTRREAQRKALGLAAKNMGPAKLAEDVQERAVQFGPGAGACRHGYQQQHGCRSDQVRSGRLEVEGGKRRLSDPG